jgi:hypothetical protein
MTNVMLTTIDNPFNPYKDFEKWLNYDEEKGYRTLETVARVANVSDEMPDKLYEKEVERAVDFLVRMNALGIYKKITKEESLRNSKDRGEGS